MSLSASRLSEALAARLDPVVPRPFRVSADGRDVAVEHPAGWGVTSCVGWLLEDYDTPEHDYSWAQTTPDEPSTAVERAETAVGAVLNSLQDAVSEATREPWPEVAPRRMAPYGTRCDGAALYLWYGSTETAPVIAFAPIVLRDLDVQD